MLKLLAFDIEDLTVLSAHLQDAVVRVADIAYLPRERRFALLASRFDWAGITSGETSGGSPKKQFRRRRTALRFEHVRSAKLQGFSQEHKKNVLSLLAIQFVPIKDGEPDGLVTLLFAAGAAIRLEVECLEAELRDLGPHWRARSRPAHGDTER